MDCVVEKRGDKYNPELLMQIWQGPLNTLDMRRIKWSYENNPCGKASLWLLLDRKQNNYCGTCVVLPRIFKLNESEVKVGITADFSISTTESCKLSDGWR